LSETADFRHEWKHEISPFGMVVLRQRISAVMQQDPYARNGKYLIRSLYFDNENDLALREKINGVSRREKFRIRYYNDDPSFIKLEKKSKIDSLCGKQSVTISSRQAQDIVDGNTRWMGESPEPLIRELYSKMQSQGIKPRTIVDYTREPFVYAPGNVRVTFDYNIRTGLSCTDFLDRDCITIPAGDAPILLEVKWDQYLPAIIRDIIQIPGCQTSAFSKYSQCRIYG